jgi:putative transposase
MKMHKSAYYYKNTERKSLRTEQLRILIRELAHDRPRFGYRRITVMLRRNGYRVSKNTVFRIYQREGLGLKKVSRKCAKRLAKSRVKPSPATMPNQRWSIDFIFDHLANGTRYRSLSVIDQFSRKCLGVVPRIRFNGADVTQTLDEIAGLVGGYPKSITSDNGSEFTGLVYDEWTKRNGIHPDFIMPGKPTQNGFVESFHGKIRDECLAINSFHSLTEAKRVIAQWVEDYNCVRPHSSLRDQVPDKIWKDFQIDLDRHQLVS